MTRERSLFDRQFVVFHALQHGFGNLLAISWIDQFSSLRRMRKKSCLDQCRRHLRVAQHLKTSASDSPVLRAKRLRKETLKLESELGVLVVVAVAWAGATFSSFTAGVGRTRACRRETIRLHTFHFIARTADAIQMQAQKQIRTLPFCNRRPL